jgi:hypothetical protein
MKTLQKNFTKTYWNWKSMLGAPFKNQISTADDDTLGNIEYFLCILDYMAFH